MSTIERALGKDKSLAEKNKITAENNTGTNQQSQAELNKQYLEKNITNDVLDSSNKLLDEQDAVIANALNLQTTTEQKQINHVSAQSAHVEIDLQHLADQGIIVPSEERSILNEEYRRIKQPLINNVKGKSAQVIEKANLIQVTSALASEGKTFTAINLAMAISQEFDHTVLLVDADLLRPSMNDVFGLEERAGLSEYLSGEVNSLSEVLLTTNIPKLTLLLAGKQHHLTSELFSSYLMENLFTELSGRYSDRIIIIDSPPVLHTNEANILAKNVGQIVFVIEQNRTAQTEVKDALSQFDDNSVIGIVMNKSRGGDSSSVYGYYY
ncbi:MAG: XrtA-associated tyrosine autokinase [Thiotrichaceae bacterium]|nr:XrtA-associated tyrosine autokinase [Thiotrichaceae bacterium]